MPNGAKAKVPGHSRRKSTGAPCSASSLFSSPVQRLARRSKRFSLPLIPYPTGRPILHRQACCPFDTHVGNDTAQGGTGRHQDLQPPGMSGQRPRFDAARPPLFQMPCEKAFYGCLAHPITDQRYSPHPHGKRAEKASFFIPTNRQRRKRCDKKEVIE